MLPLSVSHYILVRNEEFFFVDSSTHVVFFPAARSSNSINCCPVFEGKDSWTEGCCWFRHPLFKGWLIVHSIMLKIMRLHFPSPPLLQSCICMPSIVVQHKMYLDGFMCLLFVQLLISWFIITWYKFYYFSKKNINSNQW